MGLTRKQQMFVLEYLKDFNASRAARDCGYSEKSAGAIGNANILKVEIRAEIKRQLETRVMSAEEVSMRLAAIARGDVADLMDFTTAGYTLNLTERDEDGNLVPRNKTALIKKIKQRVTTRVGRGESDDDQEIIDTEIELYSAHEALRDIARMHQLFSDDNQAASVTVNIMGLDQILKKVYGDDDSADDTDN